MSIENIEIVIENGESEKEAKMKNKKVLMGLVGALVVAIIVLVVALSGGEEGLFSAISTSTNSNSQGTWELVSFEGNGEYLEGEALELAYGGEVVYDLQEEGQLVITMIGQDFTGEWVQKGEVVELMYNGGITQLEFHGECMTMGDEEITYTLTLK